MTRSTRLTAASLAGLVALTACDRPSTPAPEQAAAPTATPAAAHTFDAAINAGDFGEMVKQLASDEFEGRDPGSPGEACVGCHMPATVYLARDARRDHSFTIPDPVLTKEIAIPKACNRGHTDRTPEWAGERTDR